MKRARNLFWVVLGLIFNGYAGLTPAATHHQPKRYHAPSKLTKVAPRIPLIAGNYAQFLQSNIASIIARYDPNIDVGIEIRTLPNGNVIYRQNANRLFIPASVLKIFTAVAALLEFGTDYQFKTQILAKNNKLQNGAFNGDIFIHFDGDPTLRRENINSLIGELRKSGINVITGNVYIDDYVFDQASYAPGWMWDEQNFCYAAPTQAVMLDKNCIPLKITTVGREKVAPVVESPGNEFMQIASSLVTKSKPYVDCGLNLDISDENKYRLTGCVPKSATPINLLVAVKNIRLYAANILQSALTLQQIKIGGKILFAPSPLTDNSVAVLGKDYVVLATHDSLPLKDLTKVMLKKSDNLIADALFKKLAFSRFHQSATWRSGTNALYSILSRTKAVDLQNTRIVDGSGLSHYNLMSPSKMADLLDFAYNDAKIKETFFTSLPNSGFDGSLKYRLSTPDLRGKVHAKTGTMKSVLSLAGYIHTNSGKDLNFVIMMNGFLGKYAKYRLLEDEICAFLVRNF